MLLVGPLVPHHVLGTAEEPTTITSNTMTANGKEGKAVFQGAVTLTQGDLVVHSDIMIVHFKTKSPSVVDQSSGSAGNSGQRVDLIEAKGSVIIEKATGRATCRHAVYYKDEEKIVLTGSPVAWEGGTQVSGPKMIMYLKENRSVVEGGSRVVILDQEGT